MSKPTMTLNKEYDGIELKFDSKPDPEILAKLHTEPHRFYWHPRKKLWYGKDTPERRQFAETLCGIKSSEHDSQSVSLSSAIEEKQADTQSAGREYHANTFAGSYEKIGDAVILKDASSNLMEYMEAFCEKDQLYYRRTYGADSISIYDISNAQKIGKNCDYWSLSNNWNDSVGLVTKLNRAGIDTIEKLAAFCRTCKEMDGVSISHYTEKGVEVFSPFVEVKPLKALPDKWTKRNFTQALMSGQLFRGEVAYRYTDDYAYDAAYNYGTGRGLHMPAFAKSEIGDWGSCTYCHNTGDGPDKNGAYPVSYSEHTNSCKTLWFDPNCDIAEGKRRAEARETAIQNYNKMLEASCIDVSPEDISPLKIYKVKELDMDGNTGVYNSREVILQGERLRTRLDPECRLMEVLSVEEMEIEQNLFYSVSNFHDRLPSYEPLDDRVIPVGNWEHIVTGKALLELTAEGAYFPNIHLARGEVGPHYETALDNLTKLANGSRRYMMGGDKTDYRESIDRLNREYQRAGGLLKAEDRSQAPKTTARNLSDLVASAQQRHALQLKAGETLSPTQDHPHRRS